MRIWYLLFLLLSLTACASRVHEHFEASDMQHSVYREVFNDSIQLYLRTPSDVVFQTDPRTVDRRIRRARGCFGKLGRKQDNVLIYGMTWVLPIYQFYITIDRDTSVVIDAAACDQVFHLDTVIGDHRIGILAKSADPKYRGNYKCDLRKVLSSVHVGEAYQDAVKEWRDEGGG